MVLYSLLWWANIVATTSLLIVAYVGGINADRYAKKTVLALIALGCVLEIIFSIYAFTRAGNWVEQAIFVAITGQVQRFVLKVPIVVYVVLTSRSIRSWLGLCKIRRKLHFYPRANPDLAMPSMHQLVKSFHARKETVTS